MTTIPTVLGDKAKEETKSLAKAAGAGVVGWALDCAMAAPQPRAAMAATAAAD